MIAEEKILPKDWKLSKMEEVCDIISGKNQSKVINPNGKYPIYGSSGIFGYADEYLCNEGTTVVGRKGTINSPLFVNTKFWNVDTAFGLSPKENYDNKLLYYFCLSFNFHNLDKSTTIPSLAKRDLLSIDIPLPPKPTQQAIVSKIEELFSELDKGIEQLKAAQQQLDIYKKAVLMEGVTGKLTAQWRQENYQSETSEQIFENIQKHLDFAHKKASEDSASKGKRKPKDQRNNKKIINNEINLPLLPNEWKYYRLEDITYLVTDGTHFTPKYQENGVKFLSVKNVRPFYLKEENLKYISEEEHKLLTERCKPEKGDILYTKVGATFGYAAQVKISYEFSIFVSLCLIKPIHEYFSSAFFEILMNSELVFHQARKRVSGSGVPDLHLIEIRDFKIPLLSLQEQNKIVQEIESRLSVADNMEESINQSLQQSEMLRQSILKKAFNGELVT